MLEPTLIDEVKKLESETGLSFADLLRLLITNYRTVVENKEVEVI